MSAFDESKHPRHPAGGSDGGEFSNGEDDYRGQHKAPGREGNSPLSNLALQTFPDDIYGPKAVQYYGTGEAKIDRETMTLIHFFKGKPEAAATMYRAVPTDAPDVIHPRDWVTINKKYAQMHGEGPLRGKYKIISKTVRAGDLFTNGDSIHEWGWDPMKK